MSDMGLLITGVLTTGQPSLPNTQVNSPIQLDNDINKSEENQLSEVVPTNQITPPEFIAEDEQVLVISSAIAPDVLDDNHQVQTIKQKLQDFDESRNSPVVTEDTVKDSVDGSNVQPEFTSISEGTTTDDNFSHTFTSTTQAQDINKYTAVSPNPVHHQPQPQYIAGGLRQSPRIRNKQPTNNTRVTKFAQASPTLPILGFGNRGDAVRVLQRVLRFNGYTVQVDGIFGALTESAVKAFQNRRNLVSDGIVGQNTWRELTR
ncbi:MAG: peptidoglycan-binding protein [Pelatocladus maniniholoensis HA4357-MV3]|jgi:peptidoglycan hydrolase-like protein with peptidoglycan-binding domain|uniref:Peptidoglycan-binding protein n=1 Tax=Pelatocladus maniniholoensis HA4357-MV3 TaxID=1117104 RepID=A0A9E3LRW2_9NOST|nr:peptidoglycan-binding protein [Pelatocladus maniniholoensis HA4357-MV3]